MSANPLNVDQPTPREPEGTLGDPIPPLIAEGRAAFRRELPDLLKRYPGKWVAYSGSQRLTVGRSKTQLYQECLNHGLKRGDFLVVFVEPENADEVDLPLDF